MTADDTLALSFLPMRIWVQWLSQALQVLPSGLAPQYLNQPILPGWILGNVINVTEMNSSSPVTELEVVAKDSYGRQIGRLMDAVKVLIDERPKDAETSRELDILKEQWQSIEEIKKSSKKNRIEELERELARLKAKATS